MKITDDHAAGVAVIDRVAELWRGMLNRAEVPHDKHFAELGGDSLLLLSIITRLEEEYGVELDIEAIVEDLTVNGMAGVVDAARAE